MLGFLQDSEGPVSMTIARLADHVRTVRNKKGLSLEKIRERGGPSVGWLSQLENGTMVDTPKLATLQKLAHALGEPVEELSAVLHVLPDDSAISLTYKGWNPKYLDAEAELGPAIHIPELAHLSAAQRERVEAAAREAAREEIKRIKSGQGSDAIARVLAELPDDMTYPPTAKELKLLATLEGWEGTELDPRSQSRLWMSPAEKRWPELKGEAMDRQQGQGHHAKQE